MPFDFSQTTRHFFTPEQLARIESVTVGIAGAGGLGSNAAMNLVRCGFKRFVIADFDSVAASNLNRQFYFARQVGMPKVDALRDNLLKINPGLDLTMHRVRLDQGNTGFIFDKCDIIIEAFDDPACKAMIAGLFMESGKLLVCASGLAGFGDSDRITVTRIRENFYIVGDRKSDVAQGMKPYAPCVSIAAAKQADIVLAWVLKQ